MDRPTFEAWWESMNPTEHLPQLQGLDDHAYLVVKGWFADAWGDGRKAGIWECTDPEYLRWKAEVRKE